MGLTIQDMLSGDIVKRQAPQQDSMAGLGTLLQFLSQGQVQMPQMPALPESRPVDPSAFMHMMAQNKADKDAAEGAVNARQLMGTPGEDRLPTPMLGAHDAVEGTGYLGGKISPQEVMAGLLSNKTTMPYGFAMLNDQFAPRAPVAPHYMEMGVPGKEGYKINAIMTPNGPVAIGEPYKTGSLVSINNAPDGLPKAPEGYMYNKEGTRLYPTPGGPHDQTIKPLTDAEGKSQSYAARMQDAHGILNRGEEIIDSTPLSLKQWGETVPGIGAALGAFGNKQLNAGQQSLDQAQRQFINALLRHESGATINPNEFINYSKQYFKAYGDSPVAVAQKRKAREEAIQGMDAQSGAASPNWRKKVAGEGPAASGTIERSGAKAAEKIPVGWNDKLEEEYQRSLRGK